MKNLFTLVAFAITTVFFAQAPQGFNYQATVRNNTGALIINKSVSFKFNIITTSASGSAVYSETQTVTTDDVGQVNLVIGKGTPITGTFATIEWSTGTYFLGIELNTGNGFVVMGTTQFLSVPYALYAKSSGNETSIGDISTTSNPKGASITSGTLSLTPADSTNGGILTTDSQIIAGEKTFNSDLKINGITAGKGAGNIASNTVLGINALTTNTTGIENIAIGNSALKNNSTGGNNTAIGVSALNNNSTGGDNTAVGNTALYHNSTGAANVANGSAALQNNTIGEHNVGVGVASLVANTSGNFNVANGNYSLNKNRTGNYNVANGTRALLNNRTGNYNSAFGSNADVIAENLTNATAIGYQAIVNNSNTIQLGNTDVTDVKTAGKVTAAGFKTPNGTSSQFLMANGSISTIQKKYRLEYISGDGQIYSGGGMPLPMIFKIFNITDNTYITSLTQGGLSLNSKANIGYEDGAFYMSSNNYCDSCFGGYYYIPPSSALPTRPFNLIVTITMKYSNTGEVIDRYIINQYIR